MKLFLAPHGDDESLFGAYTLIASQPHVVICLNGRRAHHLPDEHVRRRETANALEILGCSHEHLDVECDPSDWYAVEDKLAAYEPTRVWAPLPEKHGHPDHNALGNLALALWPDITTMYATYTINGETVTRSRHGVRVNEAPEWAIRKRLALECYTSQWSKPDTAMHFDGDQAEYLTTRTAERPLATVRLNLGGGINPLAGFDNLDKSLGWMFEDGLGDYPDGTVEAVTESHAMMYVAETDWPALFEEIARVLEPGGIMRLTGDAIAEGASTRREIRPRAAVATSAVLAYEYLRHAKLRPYPVSPRTSSFYDTSLIQANYGQPPDVFHLEGIKPF